MALGPDEIKAMLAVGGNIIPASFPGDPVDPGMRNMLMTMMGPGQLKPMAPAPTNIASMVMQQRPAGMG